jgi:transposase
LKKLEPDQQVLLQLIERWRDEAVRAGRTITRIAMAFEAGRDGFWLARWLRLRGVETYVIHSTTVVVPRVHRRAKTDRLDTEFLKRVFIGWLRGEPDHCRTVAIPTLEEEDAKRPNRERENLVGERTRKPLLPDPRPSPRFGDSCGIINVNKSYPLPKEENQEYRYTNFGFSGAVKCLKIG